MSRLELQESVTLDGAGSGQVRIGPVPALLIWRVEIITLHVVPEAPMPSAEVWRSVGVTGGTMLGTTFLGARNASQLARAVEVGASEVIRVEWTGGAPGARATAYVLGEQIQPGR